jgi:hypothetical protein
MIETTSLLWNVWYIISDEREDEQLKKKKSRDNYVLHIYRFYRVTVKIKSP